MNQTLLFQRFTNTFDVGTDQSGNGTFWLRQEAQEVTLSVRPSPRDIFWILQSVEAENTSSCSKNCFYWTPKLCELCFLGPSNNTLAVAGGMLYVVSCLVVSVMMTLNQSQRLSVQVKQIEWYSTIVHHVIYLTESVCLSVFHLMKYCIVLFFYSNTFSLLQCSNNRHMIRHSNM